MLLERPRMGRVTQRLDNVTLDADDTHVLDDFLGDDGAKHKHKSLVKPTAKGESEDEDDDDAPHDLVQADEDYISS
jgi:hypothetical protein